MTYASNEDLVMMRIIGEARAGEPGRDFLVTEVSTNDLHVSFKTMMLLRKISFRKASQCPCSMCSVIVSLPVCSLQAKR